MVDHFSESGIATTAGRHSGGASDVFFFQFYFFIFVNCQTTILHWGTAMQLACGFGAAPLISMDKSCLSVPVKTVADAK